MTISPSRTATLYRVAYRREDRDPRRGYTYKVFKGEHQARAFIERLLHPDPSQKLASRYGKGDTTIGDLAPIAECHFHFATVKWEPVEDTVGNDLVTHEGLVQDVDGDWVEYTAILARQDNLEVFLKRDGSLSEAQQAEYDHNVALIEGHVES